MESYNNNNDDDDMLFSSHIVNCLAIIVHLLRAFPQ